MGVRFAALTAWLRPPDRDTGLVALLGAGAGLTTALAGPSVGLALTAVVAVGVCFFWFPGILFAAYLLIPFYKGAAQAYSPIDLTVALAMLNAAQAVPLLVGRVRRDGISKAGLTLWVGLSAGLIAGLLYAPDQNRAIARVVNWGLLVVLPVSIGALRIGSEARFVRQMLWTSYGLGAFIAILGMGELSSARRLTVLGANTINVASGALLVPLLTPALALGARSWVIQAAVFALVPAAFIVAIASGSRGPLLVLLLMAVGGILWTFLKRGPGRPSGGRIAMIAVVTLVILSATATQLPRESLERFAHFGEFVEEGLSAPTPGAASDVSSAARLALFDVAIQLFAAHPVFGVGPAGYAESSPAFLGPFADAYPHNAILQVASEFGIVGLVLFGALVGLALLRHVPDDMVKATRVLLIFILLNAMTSGDVFDNRTLWGLIMVILLFDVRRSFRDMKGTSASGPVVAESASST